MLLNPLKRETPCPDENTLRLLYPVDERTVSVGKKNDSVQRRLLPGTGRELLWALRLQTGTH